MLFSLMTPLLMGMMALVSAFPTDTNTTSMEPYNATASTVPGDNNSTIFASPAEDLSGSYCKYRSSGIMNLFAVRTNTWGYNDSTSERGCGTGLLDQLRGNCGTVYGWGCDKSGNNHAAINEFWIYKQPVKCVEQAIWWASPKDHKETGVVCHAT